MTKGCTVSMSAVSEVISLEGDMENGIWPGEQYIPEILPSPIINSLFLKRSSKEDRYGQEYQNMTLTKTSVLKSVVEFQ